MLSSLRTSETLLGEMVSVTDSPLLLDPCVGMDHFMESQSKKIKTIKEKFSKMNIGNQILKTSPGTGGSHL
jgi:hypothetical protein